jgi:hypothetical protein
MRMHRLGLAALAVFWFMGCSSVYLAYPPEGGQRKAATPRADAAVLVNPGDSHIWIVSVDGKREGVPSHGQYQFLPGRHTIRVQYYWSRNDMNWTGNDLADYPFDVKEGSRLRVVCRHDEELTFSHKDSYKGTWRFWIEEVPGGAVATTEDSGPIVDRESTGERIEPIFPTFWGIDRW